jgi:hypothetical protein
MLFCEILTPSSFSSSRLLSLFGYILSRLYMIVGSRVGELIDLHIHLYPHITSMNDRCSFPSEVGAIELCCYFFYDIHLALKTFIIYNSILDSSNFQDSLYLGSKKFQSIYHFLPSPLPSLPSQCTLIMVLLVTTEHTGMKQLALTSKKPQGHLPLRCIKPPFTVLKMTDRSFLYLAKLFHLFCDIHIAPK